MLKQKIPSDQEQIENQIIDSKFRIRIEYKSIYRIIFNNNQNRFLFTNVFKIKIASCEHCVGICFFQGGGIEQNASAFTQSQEGEKVGS